MEYFEIKNLFTLLKFCNIMLTPLSLPKGTAVIFSNYPKSLACHIHNSNLY